MLADIDALITSNTTVTAAVSIHSVVDDLFQADLMTSAELARAQQVVDSLIRMVVDRALSDVDTLISALSTLSALTSNVDIVGLATATDDIVDSFLPEVLDAIDVLVNASNAESSLHTIVDQYLRLIANLEFVGETLKDVDSLNDFAESLTTYSLSAASIALAQYSIGETYHFHSATKKIAAYKFESNSDVNITTVPECGTSSGSSEKVQLPISFLLEHQGVFDCVLMSSTKSLFHPQLEQNATRASNVVSTSIFQDKGGAAAIEDEG